MTAAIKSSKEYANLWKPKDVKGIELFHANLFEHAFSKHIHAAYTIGVNYSGCGSYWAKNGKRVIHPQTVDILNPEEVHTGQSDSDSGWVYTNIYIEPDLMQQVCAEMHGMHSGIPVFHDQVIPEKELFSLADHLVNVFTASQNRLEKETLVLEFLAALVSHYTRHPFGLKPAGEEPHAVNLIKEYCNAHLQDEVSLDDLARLTNLNRFYLIRAFCSHAGLPPHNYHLNLRLLKAKEALESEFSLPDIAQTFGFYDQSHFTRHFKKMFGVTPGQYKKSISYNTVPAIPC